MYDMHLKILIRDSCEKTGPCFVNMGQGQTANCKLHNDVMIYIT